MMDAMDKMDHQELISALADGQLRGDEFARGVQAATADARAREAWCAYHLVGEALRTGTVCAGTPHDVFLARLHRRLQQEHAAPAPLPAARPAAPRREAANDWRWKMAAGFASFAAVAAVGWNVWGTGPAAGVQPQLAAAPAAVRPAAVEASAAPMMRDPRLDRLLAAHRQLGGATAFGTTSGFLRNATFEGPAR